MSLPECLVQTEESHAYPYQLHAPFTPLLEGHIMCFTHSLLWRHIPYFNYLYNYKDSEDTL